MLTVVLKATRGNPQVKVPAPSLETGSYPKDSRRHGQPAPILAGPAYPAPPDQPSRPQTAPRSGSDPRQTTTRSPAPNSQGCATAAAIELRTRDRPVRSGLAADNCPREGLDHASGVTCSSRVWVISVHGQPSSRARSPALCRATGRPEQRCGLSGAKQPNTATAPGPVAACRVRLYRCRSWPPVRNGRRPGHAKPGSGGPAARSAHQRLPTEPDWPGHPAAGGHAASRLPRCPAR